MENRLDELFFKRDSRDKRGLKNKISWKRYAPSIFFSVIIMGLILVGIFCSYFLYSMISLFVLAIIAVMSAIDYK